MNLKWPATFTAGWKKINSRYLGSSYDYAQQRLTALPPALLGEVIDPAGRRRRQEALAHQALGLELLQTLGQQRCPDPGQPLHQVGVAPRAHGQLAQEQRRPTLADDVESPGEGAVLAVGTLCHLGSSLQECDLRLND